MSSHFADGAIYTNDDVSALIADVTYVMNPKPFFRILKMVSENRRPPTIGDRLLLQHGHGRGRPLTAITVTAIEPDPIFPTVSHYVFKLG